MFSTIDSPVLIRTDFDNQERGYTTRRIERFPMLETVTIFWKIFTAFS